MPLLGKPKYPVVDPDPTWGRVFTNMNVGDIVDITSFTGAGFAVGYFGSRLQFRGHMARFNMGIGLMAGVMYAAMSSSQRLIGVQENSYEVAKYGAKSNAELEFHANRSFRTNVELIDDGFGKR